MTEPDTVRRVLLADDERSVRRGLAMRLALEPDLAVVATVGEVDAILPTALRTRPDVAVVDVRMPPGDGLGVVPALRRALPGLRIVVLTLHDERSTRARARRAGADAFVAKSAGDAALLVALRQPVVAGQLPPSSDGGGPVDRRTTPWAQAP